MLGFSWDRKAVGLLVDRLNYHTYALVLKKSLIKHTQIHTAELLLGWIAESPGIFDKEGKPYTITSSYASIWENGKEPIPRGISQAVAENPYISNNAEKHFSSVLDEISPQKENDVYEGLWKLINSSEVAADTVAFWRSLYDKSNMAAFLANVFLYAIQQDNLKQEDMSQAKATVDRTTADDILMLNALAAKMKKPEAIIPPTEIADSELPYIEELMCAYSDADSIRFRCKTELPSVYQQDFERRRKEYYAAETINRSARDALGDNGPGEFIVLKEDVLEGVVDTCVKPYQDGYQRLLSVMEQAVRIAPGRSLFDKATWIGSSERKGVCHILAGEGQIRWVYTNV